MLRCLVVIAASLVGAALVIPAIASAGGSPEDGAIFYADDPPVIAWTADMGHQNQPQYCGIGVTGPDGYSASASGFSLPGVRCSASLTLPTPAPAGPYSWSFSLQIQASIYRDEPRSFTLIERPTPPPPPPPPPAPPASDPAPPAPQPSPSGVPVVTGVTANSIIVSLPPGTPGGNYWVYRPDGGLHTSTFGGHLVTFESLACSTRYEFKIERRDYNGNLLGTQTLSATTAACASPPDPIQPAKPTSPSPPSKPQRERVAKVWAFRSTGSVGAVARIRVATDVGATYSRFVVKVMGERGAVATVKAPVLKRGLVQIVSWRVPKTVKPGSLRFSVQALGVTKSAKAYAQLVLKKQA